MRRASAFLVGPLARWIGGLRFPTLFGVVAALLGIDLLVPDVLPFLDEILLAVSAIVLGRLRRRDALPPTPPERTNEP